MAVLKCKMCGGDIEVSQDKTFGTCDSCGSTMTFPKIDDDQRANMFNRGNHFRRMGEFDKALAVYERILQEDDTDAEAHWCCVLCRFGIEYVEDPSTFEFLPTCHRASFDSILEDVDYLAAIEHSDGITRRQYQKEAVKISEVQKGILATSQNEEPFDVFICYKESEDDGTRTHDSTYAQDIYYQLTEQGWRVFFSRITLEDKAGTEYEPYIFAALNSAKVMIMVTTSEEHANAVWVKNEWSRFLALMRKDRTKLLIPCYRNMDPYDLPEALSVLQSYDMSKIGFVQDLIRGINKVLESGKEKAAAKENVVVQQVSSGADTQNLLRRGYLSLEDRDWNKAKELFDSVLNIDAENADAYLGMMLAEQQYPDRESFADALAAGKVMKNRYYDRAKQFAKGDKLTWFSKVEKQIIDASLIRGYDFVKENRFSDAKDSFDQYLEKDPESGQAYWGKMLCDFSANDADALSTILTNTLSNKSFENDQTVVMDYVSLARKADQASQLLEGFSDEELNVLFCKRWSKEIVVKSKANYYQDLYHTFEIEKLRESINNRNFDQALLYEDTKIQNDAERIVERIKTFANDLYVKEVQQAIQTTQQKKEADIRAVLDMTKKKWEKNFLHLSPMKRPLFIRELFPIKIGDKICFGKYPLDLSGEKKSVTWTVLEQDGIKALLISNECIDAMEYNKKQRKVTWKTCSLRQYMNSELVNSLFDDREKKILINVWNTNPSNKIYNTKGGEATSDNLFLITIDEAKTYFYTDKGRKVKATAYARDKGALVDNDQGNTWWWLRSPGMDASGAAIVNSNGEILENGCYVDYKNAAIRPACWISLLELATMEWL